MTRKRNERRVDWLAEEKGGVPKLRDAGLKILLAYPNRYPVGMSNLGFQTIYGRLNAFDDVVCERLFYPEQEQIEGLRDRRTRLVSLETNRVLEEFDLVAFSVPFENDFSHVLEMLNWGGLNPHAARRGDEDPLVAAGGVAIFLNPEPLADFIDLFLMGEGEAVLPRFIPALRELVATGFSKKDGLKELARSVPGLYVPAFYQVRYHGDGTLAGYEPEPGLAGRIPFQRADMAREPVCRSVIVTPNTEFSDVSLLEIGRGCGRGCRFCAAGYVFRPPRFEPVDKVVAAADRALEQTRRLGLVSAAVNDHPDIDRLCRSLLDKGASLSFSSLRADNLSQAVLSALHDSDHHAVAVAPEAGSERLRRVINKHLSQEQILTAAETLVEFNIRHLKLYAMIGLPTETRDDLEALVALVKKIRHRVVQRSRGKKRLGTITVSVNSFVPKPFTPFQWEPFAGVRELKDRIKWIRKVLRKVPNVEVHFDLPKWAYVQSLLARGDRRVGRFLEAVALGEQNWPQALKTIAHNPDFWVLRRREREERFPWEIIDHGLRRSFLWHEYQRALAAQESPYCEPQRGCKRCGICSSPTSS